MDVCIDMYVDMCTYMCMDMRMDMRMDMCVCARARDLLEDVDALVVPVANKVAPDLGRCDREGLVLHQEHLKIKTPKNGDT